MKKTVILGTRNRGKVREFQDLLGSEEFTLRSWQDLSQPVSVVEDGKTFLENALKKARITAQVAGEIALADDSGLEVEFLQGRPGIYSARYAGPEATDEENYRRILAELNGVPDEQRGARFVCVIALCTPDGKEEWVEGDCRGFITEAPVGEQGFGYDPVFFYPPYGRTFAQLSTEDKNRVSHRAEAIRKLRPVLSKYLDSKE